MSGHRMWILKIAGFLALTIMVPTSAEVEHGITGAGGRSFATGAGSAGLAGTLSSCAAGRPGLGGGVVGGVATGPVAGAAAGVQGGADLGGGIISASVPEGAVQGGATGATAGANAAAAAILQAKCKVCHTPTSGLPKINATNGLGAVSSGRMPKAPVTLSADERATLIKAWTDGSLL